MLTFLEKIERLAPVVRRRAGQLMLVPVLLLCVWLMTDSAYAKKPTEPTYLFEVTTGVRTEAGSEENIDFFVITYTTQSSGQKTVSKVLFPAKDGWKKTFETLTAIDDTQVKRDEEFEQKYGYTLAPLNDDKQIFQSYSTDQYLFTTEEKITEIKRVQFFAGDHGSWNCRAMRIFHVTDLGGLYRSNAGASDCYVDFEGDLIAEGTMAMDLNIPWNNNRLISTKEEADSRRSSDDISLRTSGFDPTHAHHAKQDNSKKTVALRFDFADVYGAGLEAQGAMSTKNNTLMNMGLAETMLVTVYYKDIYGLEHGVTVPAVLSAAEYTASLLGDDRNQPIGGFAQQGESMALGIFLPDFASLVPGKGVTVTLGGKQVNAQIGLTSVGGKPSADAAQQRIRRIAISETDEAKITAMAIYDLHSTGESGGSGLEIKASVNKTTGAIEYTFAGSPLYHLPVTTIEGNVLRIGQNRLSLKEYESGTSLTPRDLTERYLLELTTDNVEGAGTKDDIMMSISWIDLEGTPRSASDLNVRELARDFNGWWYGSMPEDMGYYHGVSTGQTLRFFVPLQRVKTITDVRVWMSNAGNHDDWQMKDMAIMTVPNNSYSKRAVVWEDFSVEGVTDSLHFDRTVNGLEVFRYSQVAQIAALVQQGADDTSNIGPGIGAEGEGVNVMSAKAVDWSKIRYSMTFREASQELGFGKQRYTYAVTVHVAGNSNANLEDGDCGSHNLFYFRLVFKNGSSSYVLANQQLPSDGFIAGASQTFYIATNQDYGDVTAVQIIPDDISDDADQFDKLNIQSIEVERQSNAALVPVWTISNVGWISIDYRDEGQMQSVTGMAGRGASDMVRSYEVDGSTFKMNFMLAITTEGYPKGGSQFIGNLGATVHYESYSPTGGLAQLGDVTKLMYSYMNRTAQTSDDVGGKTISDPELMFRENHTDRFYFSLSDVRSIKSIDLEAIAKESTTWNISDISLFIVNGEGTLLRNGKGEYQRVYKQGEELKKIAWGASEDESYSAIVLPYDKDLNTEPQPITIYFTENTIEISPEAKQWRSIVNRTPASDNDTLNIFLFPEKGKADTVNGLATNLQYSTTVETEERVSTGTMKAVVYNDQEVFFATGINASKFKALTNVTVFGAKNGTGIRNGEVRAVIQRVRSGVVMNTWEMGGRGSTDPMGIALTPNTGTTTRRQHVQLQLGADTQKAILEQNVNDLAVAIYYRADDPSGMELRSPYIYLTDLKTEADAVLRTLVPTYTQIRPGQVIDMTFEELNIKEILGVALVSAGEISATVDSVHIEDQLIALSTGLEPERVAEIVGVYDSVDALTVTNVPYRMNINAQHTVKPLSLQFVTAETAASKVSTGTNGPVRMKIGYFDQSNNLIEKTYEDVRAYISDGSTGFASGSTVNLEMLIPDITSLRWIELEPYGAATSATTSDATEETAPSAMWTLASVSMNLNNGEQEGNFSVNRQIVEGTPLRTFVAKIAVTADVKASGDEKAQVMDDENNDLLISSGESIEISPRVIGSIDGFTAVLVKVDTTTGATGRANLGDTRGYTAESIAANASAATDSRVAAVWKEAKPEVGSFEFDKTTIKFTPPRNYTDKSVQYEIRVISNENASAILPIKVTVENESDPVAKKLDDIAKTPVQSADTGSAASNAVPSTPSPSTSGESSSGTGAGE